jgi:hypothetical protein
MKLGVRIPWELSNNQSTIGVLSPRPQKPLFRGEHNGPLVQLQIGKRYFAGRCDGLLAPRTGLTKSDLRHVHLYVRHSFNKLPIS